VLILSKRTGWGLAEILGLDSDEFWSWLEHSQVLENDMAQQAQQLTQ
jgi:hypothetical protein